LENGRREIVTKAEEREKLIKDLNRFCNDRARLEWALVQVLKKLGCGDHQVRVIVADVRKADFDSLKKTMKIV
jgi:hypothetical protein